MVRKDSIKQLILFASLGIEISTGMQYSPVWRYPKNGAVLGKPKQLVCLCSGLAPLMAHGKSRWAAFKSGLPG